MTTNWESQEEDRSAHKIRELTAILREAIAQALPEVQVLRRVADLDGPLNTAPLVPHALAAAKARAGYLRDLQEFADRSAARDGSPEYHAAIDELQATLSELRQVDAAALAAIDGIAAHDADNH